MCAVPCQILCDQLRMRDTAQGYKLKVTRCSPSLKNDPAATRSPVVPWPKMPRNPSQATHKPITSYCDSGIKKNNEVRRSDYSHLPYPVREEVQWLWPSVQQRYALGWIVHESDCSTSSAGKDKNLHNNCTNLKGKIKSPAFSGTNKGI